MSTEQIDHTTADLVRQFYEALAGMDLLALDRLLHPDFLGILATGLPFGIGGEYQGADDMRRHGWGEIARHFNLELAALRFMPIADGRMLVTGRYRGSGRRDGGPLDVPFAHIITVQDDRISGLEQYTDTVLWRRAAPTSDD